MRLPLIAPADLTPEQRPVYDDMRAGIEKHFQGFKTIAKNGALMGPWNPWLHEPKFGKPIWELTLALSVSPSLPATVREVAILVTGATFHSSYELYAHVIAAERRGLSDDKLATIVAGQRPGDLSREEAIAELLEIIRRDRKWNEDAARKHLLTLFDAMGPTDPRTLQGRRKLSSLLFS